ncbi:unnamed protein product [Phytomonas sp. EM1]|nr:unnamed protein product [Phytomonas sp. EM1]|eukprot:CCW65007.1 unnamed protein product [Phytomonas sp. isolate EM1]
MKAGIPHSNGMSSGPGGLMFDPKPIIYGMLTKAPRFLLNSLDSIIIGILAAYVVLIIFLGASNFFIRILEIAFVVGVGYGLGWLLRFILSYSERVLSPSSQNGDDKPAKAESSSSLTTAREKDSFSMAKSSQKHSSKEKVVEMD